jgi:hypothetical protein
LIVVLPILLAFLDQIQKINITPSFYWALRPSIWSACLQNLHLFLELVVEMLPLSCVHLRVGHLELHGDDFLNVLILLCLHVFHFDLVGNLQLLDLFLHV